MDRKEFIEKWCHSGDLDIRYGVVLEDSDYGFITPRRWWEFFQARAPVFQKGQVIVVVWNEGYPMAVGTWGKPTKVGVRVEYFTELYDALNRSYELTMMTAEEYREWKGKEGDQKGIKTG